MMEYANGNATRSQTPPSTNQVSLPSQNGATEFIIWSRSISFGKVRKQNPHPQIEPVQDHVHRHREADHTGADDAATRNA